MGKSFKQLKNENRDLRAALAGMVAKHNIQPGDFVIIKTDRIGPNFGYGWAGLQNVQAQMSDLAGGKIMVVALKGELTVESLRGGDLKALRRALDEFEAASKPKVPPQKPNLRNPQTIETHEELVAALEDALSDPKNAASPVEGDKDYDEDWFRPI